MWQYLLAAMVILVTMLVLDGIWLGFIMKGFYRRAMARAFTFEVRWWAALLFYLLHTVGILVFAVSTAGPEGTLRGTLVRGALFGLFTYGTYDLTNLATIRGWSLRLTLVDIVWGALVTMLSAGAAALVIW